VGRRVGAVLAALGMSASSPSISAGSPGARRLKFGYAVPSADPVDPRICDYFSTHDSGFFSNCSSALDDALELTREGVRVRRIDYSQGMGLYKNLPGRDVYARFFRSDATVGFPAGLTFDSLDVHTSYRDLPLAEIGNAALAWFTPSLEAQRLAKSWADEIGLDFAETIAIYYRGTDKGKEVRVAPIEGYIAEARRLDELTGRRRTILVQTDQAQARDAVVAAFGDRARFFSALAVTRGNKGLHKQWLQRALAGGGETAGLQMLAAVTLLSRCAEVVLTTSNVGAWIALYRGKSEGLHQFDAQGELIATD
jgi:hypothetical protein